MRSSSCTVSSPWRTTVWCSSRFSVTGPLNRADRFAAVDALFSSEVSFTQEMLLWEDGVARKLDIRVKPGEGEDGPSGEPLDDLSPVTAAAAEVEER